MFQTRRPFQEVKDIVSSFGFNILSDEKEYFGRRSLLNFIDNDGYLYYISYGSFYGAITKNNRPERFNQSNPYVINNINNWLFKNRSHIKFIGKEYLGAKSKESLFYCSLCDESFTSQWGNIYSNRGCPFCVGKKFSYKNSFAGKYPNLLFDWDYDKNKVLPEKYSYGTAKIVFWKCRDCSYCWEMSIHARTSLGRGCPKCTSSKGEKRICDFLKYNNIQFEMHKGIEGCKSIKSLPFDFILENKILIEYQGIQHFKPISFGGNVDKNKSFEELKKRDKIKVEHCRKNNIPLLIISYLDFNNIEVILHSFILEIDNVYQRS